MGCSLHQYPKFYDNVFLFVGLTTFVSLMNFDWFIKLSAKGIVNYRMVMIIVLSL